MKYKIRYRIGILTVIFILVTVSSWAFSASSPDTKGINWLTYETGMELAQKTEKKVFLHFFADWCHYCKVMNKETLKKDDVTQFLNENFISIRVDYDREKETVKKYKFRGLPTSWLIAENGETIVQIPGNVNKKMFMLFLEFAQTNAYNDMKIMAFMKKR